MVPISDLQWCEQPYRDHPFVYVSLNLSGLALVAFLVSLKVFQKFRGEGPLNVPFPVYNLVNGDTYKEG